MAGKVPSVSESSPGAYAAGMPEASDEGAGVDSHSSGQPARERSSGSSFDNLEFADSSLEGKIAVLRVGSEPTATNLLSVFAGLKNKTSHRLEIEVQTLYKDKAGNALNSGSWIGLTLKPHEEFEYRSASISEAAADFLVRVRKASISGDTTP